MSAPYVLPWREPSEGGRARLGPLRRSRTARPEPNVGHIRSSSLEAKELTHKAYEHLRTITGHGPDDEREAAELASFQGTVNAAVPIPPDVGVIEDYRREQSDG
jgi:hypothetical protein